ncbi:MAG: ATP-binding cassette domain-containing protein [Lentisphaerae bacterium]|nr:ATP-binding cassette domain-containing protein [Lentisphaerota bacterium]
MSDIAVKVENLGKKYVIGHCEEEYACFNEYLTGIGKNILRRLKNPLKPYDVSLELEDFWAVRNVSFELKKGDRLGIIGHNGSGKSTTLKMLSRITTPTEGRITMCGRIASLLEVGTGFHPELTGRENIYLNGSILGMTRAEIRAKFDEIVEFSGVERFLDTPVKRFSSGMYVRLAFAVAAHLNPEILVVDEVLSVGDVEFQKKCLGKMQDISSDNGRTILFVSHNMGAIQTLCNKGLVLEQGKVIYCGEIGEAVRHYIESRKMAANQPLAERSRKSWVDGRIRFTRCVLKNCEGEEVFSVPLGAKAVFEVDFDSQEDMDGDIQLSLSFYNSSNVRLATLSTRNLSMMTRIRKGSNQIRFIVPRMPLYPDLFSVCLYAEKDNSGMAHITDAATFQTTAGSFYIPSSFSNPYKSLVAIDYAIEMVQ